MLFLQIRKQSKYPPHSNHSSQVDLFLSRDLDSRISPREVSAVTEFLSDPRANFHVMRDHPAHVTYIMGGLWGVKVHRARNELLRAFKKIFEVRTWGEKNGFCV